MIDHYIKYNHLALSLHRGYLGTFPDFQGLRVVLYTCECSLSTFIPNQFGNIYFVSGASDASSSVVLGAISVTLCEKNKKKNNGTW